MGGISGISQSCLVLKLLQILMSLLYMKMRDMIRLTGLHGSEGNHKTTCHVRKQLMGKMPTSGFLAVMTFSVQRGLSAASVDLLIISELISDVALAFTTGTGDLTGGRGAASQPVSGAPATLS